MKLKKIAVFLLVIVIVNFITPNINIFAAINEDYGSPGAEMKDEEIGSNSTVLNWTAEIAYNVGSGIEGVGAKVMQLFTGSHTFPWIDKIIFNTIPILDINFINPANGSFFKDSHGKLTLVGEMVKKIYFSILSIAVGFLTILVSVAGIRLAISSIGSEKARYKEAINSLAICIVLIFGFHFVLSFLFFANEKMVEVASSVLTKLLNEKATAAIEKMEATEDEDNPKIVKNFFLENNDQCFIGKIPLIGGVYQAFTDFVHSLGNVLEAAGKAIISFFTGKSGEEEVVAGDEIEELYPNLNDYSEYFLRMDRYGNPRDTKGYTDEEITLRTNVGAYLLKDKFYRKQFMDWANGTDVNSLSEGGIGGVCRNVLLFVNDIFGVADNGYKSARGLFTSTALIVHGFEDVQVQSTEREAYEHLTPEQQDQFNKNEGKVSDFKTDSIYYTDMIKSTEDYYNYVEEANLRLNNAEKIEDKKQREFEETVAHLDILYANAYFKYVYQGEDKPKIQPNELINGLGEYFKQQSWYVDLDSGGWATKYINPVAAIAYTILVVQSLILLLAYIKRFFYVVILSLMAPFVMIYDFAKKIM